MALAAGAYPLAGDFVKANGDAGATRWVMAHRCQRWVGRCLLAYTLLHRYRSLNWVLEELVAGAPTTLEDLAAAIFALE
jgi:hypothetical protein